MQLINFVINVNKAKPLYGVCAASCRPSIYISEGYPPCSYFNDNNTIWPTPLRIIIIHFGLVFNQLIPSTISFCTYCVIFKLYTNLRFLGRPFSLVLALSAQYLVLPIWLNRQTQIWPGEAWLKQTHTSTNWCSTT